MKVQIETGVDFISYTYDTDGTWEIVFVDDLWNHTMNFSRRFTGESLETLSVSETRFQYEHVFNETKKLIKTGSSNVSRILLMASVPILFGNMRDVKRLVVSDFPRQSDGQYEPKVLDILNRDFEEIKTAFLLDIIDDRGGKTVGQHTVPPPYFDPTEKLVYVLKEDKDQRPRRIAFLTYGTPDPYSDYFLDDIETVMKPEIEREMGKTARNFVENAEGESQASFNSIRLPTLSAWWDRVLGKIDWSAFMTEEQYHEPSAIPAVEKPESGRFSNFLSFLVKKCGYGVWSWFQDIYQKDAEHSKKQLAYLCAKAFQSAPNFHGSYFPLTAMYALVCGQIHCLKTHSSPKIAVPNLEFPKLDDFLTGIGVDGVDSIEIDNTNLFQSNPMVFAIQSKSFEDFAEAIQEWLIAVHLNPNGNSMLSNVNLCVVDETLELQVDFDRPFGGRAFECNDMGSVRKRWNFLSQCVGRNQISVLDNQCVKFSFASLKQHSESAAVS